MAPHKFFNLPKKFPQWCSHARCAVFAYCENTMDCFVWIDDASNTCSTLVAFISQNGSIIWANLTANVNFCCILSSLCSRLSGAGKMMLCICSENVNVVRTLLKWTAHKTDKSSRLNSNFSTSSHRQHASLSNKLSWYGSAPWAPGRAGMPHQLHPMHRKNAQRFYCWLTTLALSHWQHPQWVCCKLNPWALP